MALRLGLGLGLGASGAGGGGAPAIPFLPFGTNLNEPTYSSRTFPFANFALYSKWGKPGVDLAPIAELGLDGEYLVSADDAGVSYIQRAIPAAKTAGQKMKATWNVVSGTGTIDITLGTDFATPTATSATWVSPDPAAVWYQFRVAGDLIISDLEIRECDDDYEWLYPTERWHPEFVATKRARHRGAYLRFMDWQTVNPFWFGFHAEGFRVDWADRPSAPMTVVPGQQFGSVAMGSGNASLGFKIYNSNTRSGSVLWNGNIEWAGIDLVGAMYPDHIFGESSANITLVMQAPSGAGLLDWAESSGAVTITVTPPAAATTAAQILAWFNAYNGADEGIVGLIEPYLPTGDGSGTFVATGSHAFSAGSWQYDSLGIPIEWLIEFCELVECKPHFSIPMFASEDYAEGLGAALSTVPSRLWPIKVDLGNEAPWNTGGAFVSNQSLRIIGFNGSVAMARVARELSTAFMATLRANMPEGSLHATICCHSANLSVAQTMVADTATPEDIAASAAFVAAHDGCAVAPYIFPDTVGTDTETILANKWGDIEREAARVAEHKTLLDGVGLETDIYEGGDHTSNYGGQTEEVFEDQQRDPRNKFIFSVYFAEMRRVLASTSCFIWFNDISPLVSFSVGISGWGLEEFEGADLADSPKLDAFLLANQLVFAPYKEFENDIEVSGARTEGQTLTWSIPVIRYATSVDYEVFDADDDTILASGVLDDPAGSTTVEYEQEVGVDGGRHIELRLILNGDAEFDDFDALRTIETADNLETAEFHQTIKLTGSGTWTVPSGFSSTPVRIHGIGAGGNSASAPANYYRGGGGGEYRYKDRNITTGEQYDYVCGTGGSGTATTFKPNGGANILVANAGANASGGSGSGGAGGSGGTGDGGNNGGAGGADTGSFGCGAGGGGAGGPGGAGGAGGNGGGGGASAGGGGAANLLSAGTAGTNAGSTGLGGTTGGGIGAGVGGGGSPAGAGTDAEIWTETATNIPFGPGGGGGGGEHNSVQAGAGGAYGGGAGGCPTPVKSGGNGVIAIVVL